MRHAIVVVGSEAQRESPLPEVVLNNDESLRMATWYANTKRRFGMRLLDDERRLLVRMFLVPILAYRFYLFVHNTRLWAGRRPLLLIRGRSLASQIAAFAGSLGGGDVVKADLSTEPPLRKTRFVLDPDGRLRRCD